MRTIGIAVLALTAAWPVWAPVRAAPLAGSAVCSSPQTPPARRLRACSEAMEHARDALERAQILLFRGSAWLDQGALDAAIADFDSSIALNERHAVAYNARGVAYFRIGKLDAAVSDYRAALAIDATYAAAYFNRANALLAQGELELAERDHGAVIELRPDFARGFAGRGRVRYFQARYWPSYRDLQRAVELDPHDGYSLLWAHLALHRLKTEPPEALPLPKAADNAEGWPLILLALLRKETDFAEVLKIANGAAPADRRVRLGEAHYYAGEGADIAGDREAALRHYRNALELGQPGRLEYIAATLALQDEPAKP